MPYLIFDIETHPDTNRVCAAEGWKANTVFVGDRPETAAEGAKRILEAMCKEAGCMPATRFHVPNTAVLLLVDDQLSYIRHAVINPVIADGPFKGSPDWKSLVAAFWSTYSFSVINYPGVTLVGFNSSRFDIPVLELSAVGMGIDMSFWFKLGVPNWQDPRSRFAPALHLDLLHTLSNSINATQIGGSLHFWSTLCGLPGKVDTHGGDVSQLLAVPGGREKLVDYCSCDVMNTYGLLFRYLKVAGRIPQDWRCETFTKTMEAVLGGRGPEAQNFINLVRSDGLF